jgi:hypothetical protein
MFAGIDESWTASNPSIFLRFIVSRTERAGKWQKGAETKGKIEGLPL